MCEGFGWYGHDPAFPAEDPFQREGPLGIDLSSNCPKDQTSSATCPMSHASARTAEGQQPGSEPHTLSCWPVCLRDWSNSIYLCGYPKMSWWLWKSPRCTHTETSLYLKRHFLHKWLGHDFLCISGLRCFVTKFSMLWDEGCDVKVCYFKPLPTAVFFTLCCRVFLGLPGQWGFCPSPPQSSVFILLYNLNWIFLLNSF